MTSTTARVISYMCHPLFLYFYLVLFVYWSNPFSFNMPGERDLGVFYIMTFTLLIVFPLIAVILMRNLALIKSLEMKDKTERIGPLIATMIFYIWYFINVQGNNSFPTTLSFTALGGAISVGLGFFINNFTRISLHTLGAGSFLTAVFIIVFNSEHAVFVLPIPFLGGYYVSVIFVLLLSVLMAGMVGSSRIVLEAHKLHEIYGGYLVGIFAQILAFRIMF